MGEINLSRAGRYERKRQSLRVDKCSLCGADDISTLQSVTLCAECRLTIQGKATTEKHHMIRRAHASFSVHIPANLHAILTDMVLDHPKACNHSRDLEALYALKDWLELLHEMTLVEIETLEGKNAC